MLFPTYIILHERSDLVGCDDITKQSGTQLPTPRPYHEREMKRLLFGPVLRYSATL